LKYSLTICAEVGLGFVEILALGAAIGKLTYLKNSKATRFDGILIQT